MLHSFLSFPYRSDFVYDLFEHMSVSSHGGGGGIAHRSVMRRGGKPSRKKATVSSQFKVRVCLADVFMCGYMMMGGYGSIADVASLHDVST